MVTLAAPRCQGPTLYPGQGSNLDQDLYFMLMKIRKFNDILWQRRPLTSFDSCFFTHFLSRRSSVCWRYVGIFLFYCPFSRFFRSISSVFYSTFLSRFFPFLRGDNSLFPLQRVFNFVLHFHFFYLISSFYFLIRFSTHGTMYNYAVAHSYIQTYNDVVYTRMTVIQCPAAYSCGGESHIGTSRSIGVFYCSSRSECRWFEINIGGGVEFCVYSRRPQHFTSTISEIICLQSHVYNRLFVLSYFCPRLFTAVCHYSN